MKLINSNKVTEALINKIDVDKSLSEPYIFQTKINEFKRPNQCESILKYIELKINNKSSSSIDDYLDFKNPQEIEYYRAFKRIIPAKDSMNPHIKPYPSAKYFVYEHNNQRLNHLDKLDDLLSINNKGKLKITECDEGILHIGEKGSGKTFSQNIWLHNNHDKLEANNIFWVRLDFAKLIDIWKETKANKTNIFLSTEDYFLGQITYVFAKHFIKQFPAYSPFIGKVVDSLRINKDYNYFKHLDYNLHKRDLYNSSDIEFIYSYLNKRKLYKITDVLELFEEHIAIYEGFYKGNERKPIDKRRKGKKGYLIDKVFLDSYQNVNSDRKGLKTIWTFIGQRLREFIVEGNNYHILYIIDGIDNINYHHIDRENFIDEAYKQIVRFPLLEERLLNNEIVLISLRDTSLEDLINKINQEEYIDRKKFRNIDSFHKIHQDSNGIPKQALNRRIKNIREQFKQNNSKIKEVMDIMLEYNNVIDEKRWYSNIRTFIYNHLNLAKLIAYRYYFAGEPSDFNIRSQIDNFENLNFLLNGKLFINETVTTPKSNAGYNFFNLFGFSKDEKPKYFIYTHIMQIILGEKHIDKNKLINRLKLLYYFEDEINFCLDRLTRRGMISINYTSYAKHNNILYSITQKGRFALEIFYSDIHFLYHSSIDTLLPISIIKKLKYASNHSEDHNKTYYSPYCIITGLSFLQHLIECNNSHLNLIENTKDIDITQFSLPINMKLLKSSIKKMVDSIIKNSVLEYKEALNDHFGINNVW